MLILILGVALWWAPHLWKRAAPAQRAQFGDKGKGLVTGALILSVLLMIWGYRIADGPVWWGPSPALVGINNLLILIAFYLFAASGMKTRVTAWTRHPQLIGFSLWAFAHLLVNGDLPSLVLFGGLLVWALVEMAVINRTPWTPPAGPFPVRKEIMAAAGAIIVTLIVGVIHGWLGPWPFGG
ncbi:NnrU family protein [Paracoccus stylophorae]|uniref:NnrU family protein n=1 Tax=Paracoccus stylophorae TaxID=659350 RepID=A0ABY7SZ40_9RHOB|nr:NnrU family protein [Paracoccus stylophorae]WCR12138.1 NnrU family protein [Paracoccus stylophorae]